MQSSPFNAVAITANSTKSIKENKKRKKTMNVEGLMVPEVDEPSSGMLLDCDRNRGKPCLTRITKPKS